MRRKSGKDRFYVACRKGYYGTASQMLAAGWDPNTPCTNKRRLKTTPLCAAANHGKSRIVSLLIEYNVDVNLMAETGSRPLFCATGKHRWSIVEMLLDAGADVNLASSKGVTPLMIAGSASMMQLLIERGASVDLADDMGWTALMYSTWGNICARTVSLLEAGADASLRNMGGKTALDLAKEKNNTSMVRVLLAARDGCLAGIDASRVGPAQTDTDGSDYGLLPPVASHQEGEAAVALVLSGDKVQGGKVEQAEAKRSGSDAGATQRSSTTAEAQRLHNACKNGDHSVVSRLFAAGVDPNTSCFGVTPLYVAAKAGWERIVSLLIEYKVDVDCLTLTGSRPLTGAASMGNLRIVELLLDAGGDVNLASSTGITPLMVASSVPVLKLLLARGALLDLVDESGCTALYHAARRRRAASIPLLFDAGADASLRDAQGNTALDVARLKNFVSAVKLLSAVRGSHQPGVPSARKCVTQDDEEGYGSASQPSVEEVQQESALSPLAQARTSGVVRAARRHAGAVRVRAPVAPDIARNSRSASRMSIAGAEQAFVLNPIDRAVVAAVSTGDHAELERLIRMGADPNSVTTGASPLCCAASFGERDMLRRLVELGADINLADSSGLPPLLAAMRLGHVDCVEELLRLGANADAADDRGVTALMQAARSGSNHGIRCMLASGARVNARSFDGRTPLMYAATSCSATGTRMLLEAGADVLIVGAAGHSACDIARACEQRCETLINVLADAIQKASDARTIADTRRLQDRERKDRLWRSLGRALEADSVTREEPERSTAKRRKL